MFRYMWSIQWQVIQYRWNRFHDREYRFQNPQSNWEDKDLHNYWIGAICRNSCRNCSHLKKKSYIFCNLGCIRNRHSVQKSCRCDSDRGTLRCKFFGVDIFHFHRKGNRLKIIHHKLDNRSGIRSIHWEWRQKH